MATKKESVTVEREVYVCDICGKKIVLKCSLFFCRVCGAELCIKCAHFIRDEDGEHQYPSYCPNCYSVGAPFLEEELAEDKRYQTAIRNIIARWKQTVKEAEDGVGHARIKRL